jgi:three-Cys-motif partner protein
MHYKYGSKADEIDPFFEKKRSWSKIKDEIVGKYIDAYLRTVHGLHSPVVIVDAFAGPGIFGDDSLGSPLIICNTIRENLRRVGIRCVFADIRPAHRDALKTALSKEIAEGLAEAPLPDCTKALTKALESHPNATIFFYLDPYGIRDLEFEMLRQIYQRSQRRSTELLMNFSYRWFMRLSGNWAYGASASDVAQRVKDAKVETVDAVMGGDYWRPIVTNPKLSKTEREEAVISAYLERVRQFCRAYAVPVKERQEDQPGIPDDELAHYHLIFATRSPRAVVYMNDIALTALEPYFAQFRAGLHSGGGSGLLFDVTPERYQRIDASAAKEAIVQSVNDRPLTRPEIYEVVIPQYFMQHKKKVYRAWIDELTFTEARLFPDPNAKRGKDKLNDEVRLSAQAWSYSSKGQ